MGAIERMKDRVEPYALKMENLSKQELKNYQVPFKIGVQMYILAGWYILNELKKALWPAIEIIGIILALFILGGGLWLIV